MPDGFHDGVADLVGGQAGDTNRGETLNVDEAASVDDGEELLFASELEEVADAHLKLVTRPEAVGLDLGDQVFRKDVAGLHIRDVADLDGGDAFQDGHGRGRVFPSAHDARVQVGVHLASGQPDNTAEGQGGAGPDLHAPHLLPIAHMYSFRRSRAPASAVAAGLIFSDPRLSVTPRVGHRWQGIPVFAIPHGGVGTDGALT